MTVENDIKNLFSKNPQGSGSPYKETILYSILIVCSTVLAVYFIYFNRLESLAVKDEKFASFEILQQETAKVKEDLQKTKAVIEKNSNIADEVLAQFTDEYDQKFLFNTISLVAAKNNVTIKNITRGTNEEIGSEIKILESNNQLDLLANFADFAGFKTDLMAMKPILRINNEIISILEEKEGDKNLSIKISLTDYLINKGQYENIIKN
jgi:hypothetical protein